MRTHPPAGAGGGLTGAGAAFVELDNFNRLTNGPLGGRNGWVATQTAFVVADEWTLTLPTPGSNNVAAAGAGLANPVINEWLADAGACFAQIRNACASVTSAVTILTIGPPPVTGGTVSYDGTNPLISFLGTPLFTYAIQRTEILSPPAWTNIASVEATVCGLIHFLDTNAPPGQAFYRAVWPPTSQFLSRPGSSPAYHRPQP
jgi:hypothetical protein